jgi:hypothetical protein
MEYLLNWLESRTCGINQRVSGSSPEGGAEKARLLLPGFLLSYNQAICFISTSYLQRRTTNIMWAIPVTMFNGCTNIITRSSSTPLLRNIGRGNLAAVFECSSKENEAIKIERFIKKQKSRKLIEQLINPSFSPNGALSSVGQSPAPAGLIRGSLVQVQKGEREACKRHSLRAFFISIHSIVPVIYPGPASIAG